MISLLMFLGNAAFAGSLDKVLAIVNDDVITQLELEKRFLSVSAEMATRGGATAPKEVLRRQLLDRMISDKLQLQAAARMGLTVSEEEVNEAITSIARTNNMTVRQLRTALAAEGIAYADFREGITTQLMIRQIFLRRIRNRVVVTDEELDDFIARGGGKADAREYDISHILVRVPETNDTDAVERAKRKVEEAVSKVKGGMDFSQAAEIYSDSSDALEGGRLGWRNPEQLPELFTKALSEIDRGQMSRVLQSENGFHVLYINEARGDNATAVEQTKVRHILIRTDEFLSETEAKYRLAEITDRIRNGADFGELARVHSDDAISAGKGGELGWVMPGELTGSFEAAMEGLGIGVLSEPVQSPFGFHLIEVLDRRQQNMGDAVTRGRARGQLVAEKSEEKYEDWVQRLRDQSYIEILDEDLAY